MSARRQEHVERCEGAITPPSQCRCRCAGRCHGRRLIAQSAGREAFESLPEADPHRLESASEKKAHKRGEQLVRKRLAFIEEVRRRSPERATIFEARWFAAAG